MENNNWKALLPADFAASSKVWIYQGSRPFSEKEVNEIDEQLHQFYSQWLSHGAVVKGWAKLLFNQFIIVMADESASGVSGCSTDSSVRVIKSIERQYSVSFFDRMTITFLVNDKAQMLPYGQIQYAIDKGYIGSETLVFNNIATNKQELEDIWLVPMKESWLASRVTLAAQ